MVARDGRGVRPDLAPCRWGSFNAALKAALPFLCVNPLGGDARGAAAPHDLARAQGVDVTRPAIARSRGVSI